jgi:hypothetical protein
LSAFIALCPGASAFHVVTVRIALITPAHINHR